MLNLERCHEPLGQQIERIRSRDVRGLHVRRAWLQEPGDEAALMALDAFKLKHRGPGTGFFLRRSAQVMFEPGMASSHDHIPPDLVVERVKRSLKASGGEDLQIEEPVACG